MQYLVTRHAPNTPPIQVGKPTDSRTRAENLATRMTMAETNPLVFYTITEIATVTH